jgi:AraC-like DNA-binding protein
VDAAYQVRPRLACIEFDYPDMTRLQAVCTLKGTFPELPLLMFTEYHSEALAIWAFRSGVWDYRVKPITRQTLARTIEMLLAGLASRQQVRPPGPWLPADLIEPAGHLQKPPSTSHKTGSAIAYIAQHFEQDLKRDALADLSHVSPSEFSRAFRREQGTTFKHFLLEYRIARARDFIAEAQMTISEVAYASGFCDTSYFSRVFRQMVGVTASEYQRRARIAASSSHTSD